MLACICGLGACQCFSVPHSTIYPSTYLELVLRLILVARTKTLTAGQSYINFATLLKSLTIKRSLIVNFNNIAASIFIHFTGLAVLDHKDLILISGLQSVHPIITKTSYRLLTFFHLLFFIIIFIYFFSFFSITFSIKIVALNFCNSICIPYFFRNSNEIERDPVTELWYLETSCVINITSSLFFFLYEFNYKFKIMRVQPKYAIFV